ncbi:MAG: phosphatidylglycerophosphatase A family protein [Thiobacillaceae bacterium]
MTTSLNRGFLLAHPAHFIALGFGAGLATRAPGPLGTLGARPLLFLIAALPALAYWGLLLLGGLVGVWACGRTGSALGVPDHGGIVWDEISAFLLVLHFAPQSLWGYALAFALFRLFDIWKPFPIGWLEARVKGGLGVMLDDVLAAGYAIVCLMGVTAWM